MIKAFTIMLIRFGVLAACFCYLAGFHQDAIFMMALLLWLRLEERDESE